ncbi:hypothetical protein [Allosphingosinicella vermicomposti]|uniref:hypothetical protein n=1 Tax=Allosphingosinicella vermicomposti TaxID=614671 RepID=UPI000D0F2F86|nr:hypothetical protein [Allosphingosinicella vermicomposti]
MKHIVIAAALLTLAACSESEPESVENRAKALEADLTNRADELEAEAANGVAQAEADLNEEFADFGNEVEGDVAVNEATGE